MTFKPAAIAAAAAFFAGPALAADAIPPSGSPLYSPTPMVTAHIEMGAGAIFGNNGLIGNAGGGVIGAGRGNKVLWQGWNMELEAGGAAAIASATTGTNIFSAYGHLWRHWTAASEVGFFGGAAFVGGVTFGTFGVEDKTEFGPMNVGVMVSDTMRSGQNFLLGSLAANDYLDPNTRLGVKATVAGGGTYVLTADAEHRFVDPISIWGAVNYGSSTSSAHAWAALVGLRIFADGTNGTLRGQDDIVPWHITDPLRAY